MGPSWLTGRRRGLPVGHQWAWPGWLTGRGRGLGRGRNPGLQDFGCQRCPVAWVTPLRRGRVLACLTAAALHRGAARLLKLGLPRGTMLGSVRAV